MQDDVGSLHGTFKLYFTVALPLATRSLVLAEIVASTR